MDSLTYRSGIDHTGRKIHGDAPAPSQGERHENRHRRAGVTMAVINAQTPKVRVVVHADGRRAYPGVVQYDVGRTEGATPNREDLPPVEAEVPYEAVVHDLVAHDLLRQHGALEVGHRLPPSAPVQAIDNRAAPQS